MFALFVVVVYAQPVGLCLMILQALHAAFPGRDLDILLQVGEVVVMWLLLLLCCAPFELQLAPSAPFELLLCPFPVPLVF